MQRYFAKEKNNNSFILYDSDLHHIKNVMRYKEKDEIAVIYQKKIHICTIKNIEPLQLEITKTYDENNEMNVELNIAVALVSEQKFDLILQKLTELGISKIIPLKTERSIVKLDDKKKTKKLERWQMICKEASEQSHRMIIPQVQNITTIKELTTNYEDLKLLCSLNKQSKPLNTYLKDNIKSILFVIGPEGGFTPQEEQILIENSFLPVNLGKRIMRVETATIYVASIINYIYGG